MAPCHRPECAEHLIAAPHFRLETSRTLRQAFRCNGYAVSLDLTDAFPGTYYTRTGVSVLGLCAAAAERIPLGRLHFVPSSGPSETFGTKQRRLGIRPAQFPMTSGQLCSPGLGRTGWFRAFPCHLSYRL